MKRFFTYRFKSQAGLLLTILLFSTLFVFGAAAIYQPPQEGAVSPLASFRAEAPILAALFNMRISVQPAEHLLSTLFGVIFPLLSILYVFVAARKLQLRPLESGEMLWFLAAPRARMLPVVLHGAVLLLGLLLQYAVVYVASWAATLVFSAWSMEVLPLARACVGAVLMMALPAGVALYAACLAEEGRMSPYALWLTLLFFALRMVANLRGETKWLRYATPFSLFDVWGVMRGQPQALMLMALPLVLGLVLCIVGAIRFNQRDLS